MANQFDNVKGDIRFYALWLIIWIILAFILAETMGCLEYHSCEAGDFVLYLIFQLGILGPSAIASWVVISIINYFTE